MKDRTSKYPGRVKLTPVAGQANIYDMTRADEPDDTGTPFNTRTMLQDSTAQYLKLPIANPFVDDALRHMPDRIEPIGTVKTSPAQSLGDAWLKCDGSMVTFEHYPQLCSILKNTSGSVTWSANAFPSTYTEIEVVSEPIFFDGKWIIAIRNLDSWVKVLSASTLDGTWEEEASFAAGDDYTYSAMPLIASENYCVLAYLDAQSDGIGYKLQIKVRTVGGAWASVESGVEYPGSVGSARIKGADHCGDRFAVLVLAGSDAFIAYSDTPSASDSWERTSGMDKTTIGLSCANGKWFIFREAQWNGATGYRVFWSDDAGLFNFTQSQSALLTGNGIDGMGLSGIVYFSGMYRFFAVNTRYGNIKSRIYQSSNLTKWSSAVLQDDFYYSVTVGSASLNSYIVASSALMAMASIKKIVTTADPSTGTNPVSIDAVDVFGLGINGMVIAAATAAGVYYHDYTYDSRLLPTISLSDDTTTFIKAKNELDVFESGGD